MSSVLVRLYPLSIVVPVGGSSNGTNDNLSELKDPARRSDEDEALILMGQKLAEKMARKFTRDPGQRQDLEDAGVRVIIRAVDEKKFEGRNGASISTFFHACSYRAMKREIQKGSRMKSGDSAVLARIVDNSEGPEAIAAQREIRDKVREVVGSLPPKYREIVGLFYFDGLKRKEIADQLGTSEVTVKMRLNHARGMLEKKLSMIPGIIDRVA